MWQIILEALATAVLTDTIVKKTTGQHVHEHLFNWWCELRDYVTGWLRSNQNLEIRQVGLAVLDCFDDIAVRTKQTVDRITVGMFGVDARQNNYEIITREVLVDEALAQFPELRQQPVLIQKVS